MGLFLMVAAAVNPDHFILDGAIWKLNDSRVGAILLAQPDVGKPAGPVAASRQPGLQMAGWAVAALSIALSLYGAAEDLNWSTSVNRDDRERALQSAERLCWIGRADPRMDTFDGLIALRAGEFEASLAAYQESLELYPTAEAYFGLAVVHTSRRELEPAEEALRACIRLDPNHGKAHRLLGLQLARRGALEIRLGHLKRASRLMPAHNAVKRELESVRAALGRATRP